MSAMLSSPGVREVRPRIFAEHLPRRCIVGFRGLYLVGEASEAVQLSLKPDARFPCARPRGMADAFVSRLPARRRAPVGAVLARGRRTQVKPLIVQPVAVAMVG